MNTRPAWLIAAAAAAAATVMGVVPACEPLGLGLPTTLDLEKGVSDELDTAKSFELSGSYVVSGVPWSVDLQLVRPQTEHVLVSQGTTQLEAVVIGSKAYFRGRSFLSQHLGTASAARTVVDAAGSAWWIGTASDLPDLSDFTSGTRLRADFLGPVATQRLDHVSVDGVDAAVFVGPRADVYISEAAPHQLVRLHIKRGAVVDGIAAGDMHYSNYDHDFGIVAPRDVIDFSNLSTLPPEYTVESVDTSGCGSPCQVSAVVKNLGGRQGGRAPSTVTFSLADSASTNVLGTCTTQVQPDVDYNSTTTVSCAISVTGSISNAAIVTATPYNPGRA